MLNKRVFLLAGPQHTSSTLSADFMGTRNAALQL